MTNLAPPTLDAAHSAKASIPASSSSNCFHRRSRRRETARDPIDLIERNPFQTRSHVNEEQLAELAASIAANGVVQPVLVRPLASGRFQLIAANGAGGLQSSPAKTRFRILRQVSDEQAMEITIVENLQRADLNAMEQARAFDAWRAIST